MPTLEDLLKPISVEKPAGTDQSGEPDWHLIKEARRSDDKLVRGNWDRPLKEADWHEVHELSAELLSHKTKDLRLAVFLTEAKLNLNYGFPGLSEGLALIGGFIQNFWDSGLFPEIDDGDLGYRAQALDWLGYPDKLPDLIRRIPVTKRSDQGPDYSFLNFEDARAVGWEKDLRTATGDIDETKARKRESSLAAGHLSREMFENAVNSTSLSDIESISTDLEKAWEAFLALDKVIDDKFGSQGPSLQATRGALDGCRNLIQEIRKKKREEEPQTTSPGTATPTEPQQPVSILAGGFFGDESGGVSASGSSWQAAESLVRAGNVKDGLAEMTRLAASEHGRIRFHRKLRLAETCFSIKRERLAIAILEELAKEIDEHHLENWESAELVGQVWGRLYRSYKTRDESNTRALELFDRLCRLDPWQALRWEQ